MRVVLERKRDLLSATVLMLLVLAGVIVVGTASGVRTTAGEPALVSSTPTPDVIAPIVADTGAVDPGRVSASDWVIVTKPHYSAPPVEQRPGTPSSRGSGSSSGGAWYVMCGPGSLALEPAPPCGFDDNGDPITGTRVWIDG